MRGGHLAQHPQVVRVVEPHPAGALHDRLDDDRGEFVGVPLDQVGQRAAYAGSNVGRRRVGEDLRGSTPLHSRCMPPSGSQTLIGWNVSPW